MDLLDGRGLEVGERVALVGGGELAHEVLARLSERLVEGLAHPVLDGGGAAVPEAALELLCQLAVLLPEHRRELGLEELRDRAGLLGELLLHLPGGLLELHLDELRVGPRLLAVEHARADLDRVAHRLGGVVAGLLPLADEADGAFVVDHEAVDRHDLTEDPDVRLPEWSGCFHVD